MKRKKFKDAEKPGAELTTIKEITWCPGCPDHIILESSRRAILNLIKDGYKRENFAMVACPVVREND